MLEERAKVLSVAEHSIWVSADRQQGCAKCEAGEGCGGGMLTKLVKRKAAELEVRCEITGLQPGDEVIVGLDERALLKTSLMAYLVPVIGLFAGALFAQYLLGANDLVTAAMGLVGLAAGFLLLGRFSERVRAKPEYMPTVLKRSSGNVTGCQVYVPGQK